MFIPPIILLLKKRGVMSFSSFTGSFLVLLLSSRMWICLVFCCFCILVWIVLTILGVLVLFLVLFLLVCMCILLFLLGCVVVLILWCFLVLLFVTGMKAGSFYILMFYLLDLWIHTLFTILIAVLLLLLGSH